MARKKYKRNYKRYKKRRGSRDDGTLGLFVVAIVILALISGLAERLSFEGSLAQLIQIVVVFGGVIFVCVLGWQIVRKFLQRMERRRLYQQNRSVEEVRSMSPEAVEHFVGGVYERHGYTVERVTQFVADHGIDLVLRKDGKRYAVQVKRYQESNTIGEEDIRGFYGSFSEHFDEGIFVTTSHFTKAAQSWIHDRKKKLTLVDKYELGKMMRTYDQS